MAVSRGNQPGGLRTGVAKLEVGAKNEHRSGKPVGTPAGTVVIAESSQKKSRGKSN